MAENDREKKNRENKDQENKGQDEGTETYQLAMETTGETAPRSDLGGNIEARAGEGEADEEFDSTSGAGGTTAGGGTSGSTT